jgi:acetyl esterase/lipase
MLLSCCLTSLAVLSLAADPIVVRLWPNGAPNGWKPTGIEHVEERGKNGVVDRAISNVSDPTITIFPAPVETRTGAAVLIAPGGGYAHLAYDKEGLDIARWLNTLGITGVVLKYRMPVKPTDRAAFRATMLGEVQAAAKLVQVSVEDAREAIRVLRSERGIREWKIDKTRIGMMGFSAGGHLASLLGMDQDVAVRPNFLALLYPAMPADPLPVTASAPQSFLAHASDDALSADNSIRFYQALRKAKVPAEMHIFSEGGHGFGIRKSGKTSENWPGTVCGVVQGDEVCL